MDESSRNFLRHLLSEPGISGYEHSAQRVWREYMQAFCPPVDIDAHGNHIATLKGEGDFSVMITGHIDEIGLIVRYINDKGYIYVAKVGGVEPNILPSQRVRIVTKGGLVPGVVGTPTGEWKKREIQDIWLDIGAQDKEEARNIVEPGDPIVYGGDLMMLKNNRATGRNFDDRMGCYLVAEILRELSRCNSLPVTVYGVSSVQEEVGGLGAGNIAFGLQPNIGIALDVTYATDYPTTSCEKTGEMTVGKGPVLIRGVRSHQKLFDTLRATANEHNIPYQIETETGRTGTDADAMARQKISIPVSVVSVACRYMHSSCEVISLDDLDKTVALLVAYLKAFDPAMDFVIR